MRPIEDVHIYMKKLQGMIYNYKEIKRQMKYPYCDFYLLNYYHKFPSDVKMFESRFRNVADIT